MKIIFGAGIFDLFHSAHRELLEMMRKEGDKTVIILHDDVSCYRVKDKFPVQDLEHRARNLRTTGLVNEIVYTYNTDPANEFEKVIKKYEGKNTLLYMRGDDWTTDFLGRHMLDKYKVPIKFKEYTKNISSSKLRDEL